MRIFTWFPWRSGYHVRLTRARSPVQFWPETLLALLFFYGSKIEICEGIRLTTFLFVCFCAGPILSLKIGL